MCLVLQCDKLRSLGSNPSSGGNYPLPPLTISGRCGKVSSPSDNVVNWGHWVRIPRPGGNYWLLLISLSIAFYVVLYINYLPPPLLRVVWQVSSPSDSMINWGHACYRPVHVKDLITAQNKIKYPARFVVLYKSSDIKNWKLIWWIVPL